MNASVIALPLKASQKPEAFFPYETIGFHRCWQEFLAQKFQITNQFKEWVVHQKRVFKIASMNELRLSGWNNAWCQDLTEDRLEQLASFCVASDKKWDYARIDWSEDRQDLQTLEALQTFGFLTQTIAGPTQYLMNLETGWNGYLETHSRSTRKDIRKKLRAVEAFSPEFRTFSGDEGLHEFFGMFFKYHIPYWDQKAGYSYFNDARERAFAVEWARTLQKEGRVLLEGFYLNDTLCNLSMTIIDPADPKKTAYAVLTINTGAYVELIPGLVSIYLRAKRFSEEGVARYNLGGGDYPYKIQAANAQIKTHTLLFANPKSWAGKSYVGWLNNRLAKGQ